MDRVWMVVEDDPIIRSILATMMALWDVQALVFEDGYQAWEWLDMVERGTAASPLPEVALLDIRLRGPQGPAIGRRMRQIPATAHIPIVVMTAYYLGAEDLAQIREAVKPDLLLIKPLPSPPEFREMLERAIAARSSHRITAPPEHRSTHSAAANSAPAAD